MSLTPILAFTLLPLLSLVGGLAMMFASQAPITMRPGLFGFGAVMLVVACGGLALTLAMQAVRAHAKALRREP